MNATVLFAGCGGSSLGLERAGFRSWGYEKWNPAIQTHNANEMTCFPHDLSSPRVDMGVRPCDLLWASPPCQPFSAAGDGEGELDDRDGFPWTIRIISKLLPPVVIIENVKGVTFSKHADYFSSVLRAIAHCGYRVDWRVLNSADYGVPQTRERCFIVARRDNGPIRWPAPTHAQGDSLFLKPWVTMAEALGWDEGAVLVGNNTIAGVGLAERPASGQAMTVGTRGDLWTLHYRQTNRDGEPITCDVTDRPAPTIGTQSASQWVFTRPATTIAGDTRVFQPGGHHEPGEQSQNAIRLTIAELAKLQGFPDDYVWTGTKTDQARMIGNAVPPVMAQVLAEANRPVTR